MDRKTDVYRSRFRESVMTFLDFIKVLVVAFAVTALVLTFIRVSVVDGYSMLPTFDDQQKLVVLRTAYRGEKVPERGDLIIAEGTDFDVQHIIKRVVGLPGETVEMKNNKIYINGKELDESYIREPMEKNEDNKWVLKENEYFICGDNRNYSADSRIIGPINEEEIFGKIVFDLSHLKVIK